MRRLLFALLLLGCGLLLVAASPRGAIDFDWLLNGREVTLGRLTVAANSVSNRDGGQPFSVSAERALRLSRCTTGVYWSAGVAPYSVSASQTLADAGVDVTFGTLLEPGSQATVVLNANDTIAAISTDGGTGTCIVYGLRY